jgi:hypothetical protein
MSNNFGSIDINAIDKLAHVVPNSFNLIIFFLFFINRNIDF